jgi:hypothetical protein
VQPRGLSRVEQMLASCSPTSKFVRLINLYFIHIQTQAFYYGNGKLTNTISLEHLEARSEEMLIKLIRKGRKVSKLGGEGERKRERERERERER